MDLSNRALVGRRPGHMAALVAALLSVVVFAVVTTASAVAGPRRAAPARHAGADRTSLVNEMIGTENAGLDFPSTGAPFGMVQESALMQTRAGPAPTAATRTPRTRSRASARATSTAAASTTSR